MDIGQQLGEYLVVGLLGRGGMGEVWRATDTKLGRDVALKVLPADFADDPERHARFEREVRVRARISSAFRIPSAPHLRLELNREILNVARATPRISLNPPNHICGTSGRAKPEAISARTLSSPSV